MGVMDFLKGLFSSKPEDQSVSNMPEQGPAEPTPEEPQMEEKKEEMGGSNDSGLQE